MKAERIGGYYGWTLFEIKESREPGLKYRLTYIHPEKRETIAIVDLLQSEKRNERTYLLYLEGTYFEGLERCVESSDWKKVADAVEKHAKTNKEFPGYPPYFPTPEQIKWMLENQDVLRKKGDDV